MALVKTDIEIEKVRKSSLLVGETIAEVARHLRAGITTSELDRIAYEFILDHGALPAFKDYNGYPATLCISVNDVVVHGIPGNQELKEGDLVSIDCGTVIDGYYGDSAFSFGIGEMDPEVENLMKRTKESLYKGIDVAVAGKRIGDIGYEVQSYVEDFGYSVVRDLVGHGLGNHLHERPEVPNYGKRGTGPKLEENMVICIEPMINLGKRVVMQDRDGWTIRTIDHKPSAHFEHAVAIRKDKADILSSFETIEQVVNHNILIIK
ncbi:MAG TPA: type I methionyl aminopeptidase [Bacteroidales bacterium]|nr:type I methionyl aminopeptidase [Bacteroidales bacterium]